VLVRRWNQASKEEEFHTMQDAAGKQPLSRACLAHCNARADAGFALVIVLWWLVLLVLLTTQITSSSHTEVLVAANVRSSAIAEAEADGAVSEAIFQMLTNQWQADGTAHFVRGPQAVAEVRIDDEGEKIDPNVAPLVLMHALLRACGATPKTAEQVSVAIVEWRSLDVLRTTVGERAPQYRLAGLSYIPPNKRFVSEDELGLVLGMTPDLLACLMPHLSVYALSVPSLQSTADRVVQQALTDAYPDNAVYPAAALVHEGAVIRITAAARDASGSKFRRVAVVRIASATTDSDFVYKLLSWEGMSD
jgi:general secretion pathway protein K